MPVSLNSSAFEFLSQCHDIIVEYLAITDGAEGIDFTLGQCVFAKREGTQMYTLAIDNQRSSVYELAKAVNPLYDAKKVTPQSLINRTLLSKSYFLFKL
jgi:hypothetical protein